jgi:Ulp1 family protease
MIRHVDGNHWYVLVADTDTRVYYVLDSLGPRNQVVAPTDARRRLPEVFDMIAAIRGEARYDAANNSPPWTQHVTTNFPRQTNAYDCGVFALCAIALVLSGADPTNLGTCAWIQPGEMTTRRNEVAETYRSGFLRASWRDQTAACVGR